MYKSMIKKSLVFVIIGLFIGGGITSINFFKNVKANGGGEHAADAGGPYSGHVGEVITLDASGSSDIYGPILGYRWDWTGDGTWDTGWMESPFCTHVYDDVFTGFVGLQIQLTYNNLDSDTASVSIVEDENQPPVADFTYSPEEPIVNEEITFDASSSYDPDGDILNWHWDLGDGNFSEGEIAYHSYTTAGEYIVSLTVTDNDGSTNIYELDVKVDPQPTKKALLIECWDYPGTENDLPSIAGLLNLNNMENLLIDYQFDNENITILINPTTNTIKAAINTFKSNQADVNILYFDGHGFKDTHTNNEAYVASDGYYYYDYELETDLSDFHNITIIFDSCFSGGMCASTDESPDSIGTGGIDGDSKVVLMACGSEDYSSIIDTESIFTTALYKAFYSGIDNRGPVEDAYYKAWIDVVKQYHNGYQYPRIYDAWHSESNNGAKFYLSSNPPKSYKLINPKCPVHLHCYDTQNNHVGVNDDGTLDLNISNVGYSGPWYEDEFLVISASNTMNSYKIVLDAYDDGFFTLECHDYNQETAETSTILYQNIPISSTTTASILINDDIFGDLLIDDDGDDIIDRTVSPTIYPERIFTPNALFYYTPESPEKNQEICFNASSSYDEDGDIIDYTWDFGDGTNAPGIIITHSYSLPGKYPVTLTITDNDGLTNIVQKLVKVILPSSIDIDPNTLNRNSSGKWVTSYIELPEGFNVSNISISSIKLNGVIPAQAQPINISDYDNDTIPDLMVKFSKSAVAQILPYGNNVEIKVSGPLVDGTEFEGVDYIKVI